MTYTPDAVLDILSTYDIEYREVNYYGNGYQVVVDCGNGYQVSIVQHDISPCGEMAVFLDDTLFLNSVATPNRQPVWGLDEAEMIAMIKLVKSFKPLPNPNNPQVWIY